MSPELPKKGRGGSRKHPSDCKCGNCPTFGPKKRERTPAAVDKGLASEVLVLEEELSEVQKAKLRPEVRALHEIIWERDANSRLTLKACEYRWKCTEKRDGKAVQNINHIHDKPIEHNVTIHLGQRLAAARRRVGGN